MLVLLDNKKNTERERGYFSSWKSMYVMIFFGEVYVVILTDWAWDVCGQSSGVGIWDTCDLKCRRQVWSGDRFWVLIINICNLPISLHFHGPLCSRSTVSLILTTTMVVHMNGMPLWLCSANTHSGSDSIFLNEQPESRAPILDLWLSHPKV